MCCICRLSARQSKFVVTVHLAVMSSCISLPPAALSEELFGCQDFTHMHHQKDGQWCVFSNRPHVPNTHVDTVTGQCFVAGNHVKHFHGTTLWQAEQIFNEGFKIGLHHRGSASSPCGIWGCTRRGDCLDRTQLVRGWSRQAGEAAVSSWDCPVVLCLLVPQGHLYKHSELYNGTEVRCWKWEQDTLVDIGAHYCEIHFFADLYKRFRKMSEQWQQLKNGDFVMCRTVRGNPASLFTENPGPMTCGRVVSTESLEFAAWKKANGSKQYRCPKCDILHKCGQPLSGMEYWSTLDQH